MRNGESKCLHRPFLRPRHLEPLRQGPPHLELLRQGPLHLEHLLQGPVHLEPPHLGSHRRMARGTTSMQMGLKVTSVLLLFRLVSFMWLSLLFLSCIVLSLISNDPLWLSHYLSSILVWSQMITYLFDLFFSSFFVIDLKWSSFCSMALLYFYTWKYTNTCIHIVIIKPNIFSWYITVLFSS